MGGQLDDAEVLGNALILVDPRFQHSLDLVLVLKLRHYSSVSVVNE